MTHILFNYQRSIKVYFSVAQVKTNVRILEQKDIK